jgi:multidrug resistance efflux pump
MTADRILELRDVDEFRLTLAARPPAIVHGTALLLILLIAGAIAWASLSDANVVVRGIARVRPADAPLKGFDDPSNEQIYAEVSGRVIAIDVKEGQHVAAGDTLVRLDTARIDNEIARLRSAIDAGDAEVAAIDRMVALLDAQHDAARRRGEAEVQRSVHGVHRSRERAVSDRRLAQVELDEATKELARARELVEQQAGPAADVAAARARVDRAKERLSATRIGVDDGEPEVLRRGIDQAERDHDVRVADLARQRAAKHGEALAARKQLANLELDRQHATLCAHRTGVVTLGGLAVGDLIAAGRLPLAITEEGHLRVDAAIGTADVASLRIGMPVRIKLDALDFQRYGTADGVITHIGADATVASGVRAYYLISVALDRDALVRGDLRGPLKPGMTGEIEAITERAPLIALFLRSLRGAISL